MDQTLICPNCGKVVEITAAFKSQAEKTIRAELETKINSQLAEKDHKIEELRKNELDLLQQKRRFEEKEKELELTIARKLDEQKSLIEQSTLKHASEMFHLKEAEKDKIISDLKNALEDAQRKATQGSQQLQGEVLELELEKVLKEAFPSDDIEEVKKGSLGADIKQVVKTNLGNVCGIILWESKRTKNWSDDWISKLKDDLRATKANIPVIISSVLPKNITGSLANIEGVWVAHFSLAVPLSELLRNHLRDVAYQKYSSQNRGTKADSLYEYFTGHEFIQQIQAMAEIFTQQQDQINHERTAMERIWKSREAQSRRMLTATAQIYGQVQGVVGSSLPDIPDLNLIESPKDYGQ